MQQLLVIKAPGSTNQTCLHYLAELENMGEEAGTPSVLFQTNHLSLLYTMREKPYVIFFLKVAAVRCTIPTYFLPIKKKDTIILS